MTIEELHNKAIEAMEQAVRKVVIQHWQDDRPLALWEDGKVIWKKVNPDELDQIKDQ